MLRSAACALLLLPALVAGCSSSDSGSSDASASETARTPPTGTVTTPEPTGPTYEVIDKDELEDALLGIDDFPTGYSQDEKPQDDTGKTFCDYKEPAKAKIRVRRDFTKGAGMDVQAGVTILRQYKDAATAKIAFEAMTKELETCRTDTLEGSPAKHSVMSAPKVGDASIGVRTEVEGATALSNYALVGPVMVNAGTVSYVSGDADEAAELLKKQVDAYIAAASGAR